MTPLDYYHDQSANGFITEDPEQLLALAQLQKIHTELINEYNKRHAFYAIFRKPQLVKGLYLWGGVGIGKTFLMDCFYHTLPFSEKMRMHFHQFMQNVHNALTKHQGEKDPLQIIAKEIADKTLVLCFDELFVSDITDAMLLGRLFKALFSRGVCLVATSNSKPDDLYKNGLQRLQFLPAIALLKENMEIFYLPSKMDYRLRHLKEAGVFYSPLNAAAEKNMEASFNSLTQGEKIETTPIEIAGRQIPVRARTKNIIWFEFTDLCHVPRSQKDYLAIAEKFDTVFVSDIPIINENEKDTICLFISMVDVFYDARVRLVMSAAESVAQLYSRGYMILEYTRTHSRLQEMQSVDYFTGEFEKRK